MFVEFHAETVTFYKKVKGFKEYQRIGSVPKYLDGSFLSDDLFTFVCEPINPVVMKTITVYPVGYKPETLKGGING